MSAYHLWKYVFLSAQQNSNISCSDQGGVIKKNTQEREHLTQPEKTFNDYHQHCHIKLVLAQLCASGHGAVVWINAVKSKRSKLQTKHKPLITVITPFVNSVLHLKKWLDMKRWKESAPKRNYKSKIPQFPEGALHVKRRHLPEQNCRKRNRPRLSSKPSKPESMGLTVTCLQ